MIVIPPVAVTDAMLVASNAVDEAAWSAGTTYAAAAVVSHNKRRWISLIADNLGTEPGSDAAKWFDDGPSNRWAMFDTSVQTATVRASSLAWTLVPGTRVTGVVLMGLVGDALTLTVRDGAAGPVIDTRTWSLKQGSPTYFDWFFTPPVQTGEVYVTDLKSSAGQRLEFALTAAAGNVAVGLMVMGRGIDLGPAEYGAQVSTEQRGRDYTDALGNLVAAERGFARGLSATLDVERTQFNRLSAALEGLIQTPCAWVLTPDQGDFSSALTFGRYQRAVRAIEGPNHITVGLEVAGYR